jgi:hypothetical protein
MSTISGTSPDGIRRQVRRKADGRLWTSGVRGARLSVNRETWDAFVKACGSKSPADRFVAIDGLTLGAF